MTNTDQSAIFMNHIQEHAPRYYPMLSADKFGVQLLAREKRPTAMLYRFRVTNDSQFPSIFVKVPLRIGGSQSKGSTYEKPLLFPKTEPRDMHWLQYSALRTIYEHFTSLGKEHLGAIRVLDYLPEHYAIFTEESNDLKLRELFYQQNRLRFPFGHGGLADAFHNVGGWLHVYHTMPKEQDVKIRHQHRHDFAEAITTLTDFLARSLHEDVLFQRTNSILIEKALETLPHTLPLGLGHGDYAMRNILIGPNARVTVLDTFAKWRTPIYEDIGYFLTGMKTSYPQIVSQGFAFRSDQLSVYENEFLKGYFGAEPIPYAAVWLYEALALLDKWLSTLAKAYQKNYMIRQPEVILINQYFRRMLKDLLNKITQL